MTETIPLFETFGKVLVLRFEFYFGKVIFEGMRFLAFFVVIVYPKGRKGFREGGNNMRILLKALSRKAIEFTTHFSHPDYNR